MSEMLFNRVLAQSIMTDRLDDVVKIYQESFADVPWNEKTKCASESFNNNCPGGFSSLDIDMQCQSCNNVVKEEAYSKDELLDRFSQPTRDDEYSLWYVEETGDQRISLAVFAKHTNVGNLIEKTFDGNPSMQQWLSDIYPESDEKLLWIEDIFADTNIREKGNLINFGSMVVRLAVNTEKVAFSTLNPKIVRAAQRDFPDQSTIFDPRFKTTPDRKTFVTISL